MRRAGFDPDARALGLDNAAQTQSAVQSEVCGAIGFGGLQAVSTMRLGRHSWFARTKRSPFDRADGRVFTGVVAQDVIDRNGRLAIPRGSTAELAVSVTPNGELTFNLDSVAINGQRYAMAGQHPYRRHTG